MARAKAASWARLKRYAAIVPCVLLYHIPTRFSRLPHVSPYSTTRSRRHVRRAAVHVRQLWQHPGKPGAGRLRRTERGSSVTKGCGPAARQRPWRRVRQGQEMQKRSFSFLSPARIHQQHRKFPSCVPHYFVPLSSSLEHRKNNNNPHCEIEKYIVSHREKRPGKSGLFHVCRLLRIARYSQVSYTDGYHFSYPSSYLRQSGQETETLAFLFPPAGGMPPS